MFVVDQLFRAQHGVAQSERLRLAHVDTIDVRRFDTAYEFKQRAFSACFQLRFDFV
jgi:hypothetical protein